MDDFTLNTKPSVVDDRLMADMQEKVIELLEDIYKNRISQVAWHKLCSWSADRVEFHARKLFMPWTIIRLTLVDVLSEFQFPKEQGEQS